MRRQEVANIIDKHLKKDGWCNVDKAANEICDKFEAELNAAFKGIDVRQDLAHEGYHGFASDTPNPKCKCCQFMYKLKKLGINIEENFFDVALWE